MSVLELKPAISSCPICGGRPYIEECAPWPRGHGPAPWAAGCYRTIPFEHFVGVNGDDQADATRLWNIEAAKVAAMIAEHQTGEK